MSHYKSLHCASFFCFMEILSLQLKYIRKSELKVFNKNQILLMICEKKLIMENKPLFIYLIMGVYTKVCLVYVQVIGHFKTDSIETK